MLWNGPELKESVIDSIATFDAIRTMKATCPKNVATLTRRVGPVYCLIVSLIFVDVEVVVDVDVVVIVIVVVGVKNKNNKNHDNNFNNKNDFEK